MKIDFTSTFKLAFKVKSLGKHKDQIHLNLPSFCKGSTIRRKYSLSLLSILNLKKALQNKELKLGTVNCSEAKDKELIKLKDNLKIHQLQTGYS